MYLEKTNRTFSEWKDYLEKGEILPYFQPILSLDKKTVFGYESLGRIKLSENNVQSLGDFFLAVDTSLDKRSKTYSNDFLDLQKSLDRKLRENALRKFAKDENVDSKLFLNVSPTLMMSYIEKIKDGYMPTPHTIDVVKELGIDPKRIVIEITEDYVHSNIEFLRPLIKIYKDFGFLIAVDDLGSKSSNLDRIGTFEPNIIKVDMQMLRMSLFDRNYKEILYTISHLSESLGISLLFEGIESYDELNQAMSFGARYLQGFLFAKPDETLPMREHFTFHLNDCISNFHKIKMEQVKQRVAWELKMEEKIQSAIKELQILNSGEIIHFERIFNLDEKVVKFYATDLIGNQISPNYIKKEDKSIQIKFENRLTSNWSWRPYFLNHLFQSVKNQERWIISQPYNDIEKNNLLRTFSKTFQNDYILFIDVLFEE